MISDAFVRVTCDYRIGTRSHCPNEIEIELTAIACNGYDLRNVNDDLSDRGWKQKGEDEHICPNHEEEDSE